MEYFIMKCSKKIMHPLEINTLQNNFAVVDDCMMLKAKIQEETNFPDFFTLNILFQYYYFVSIPFYELLQDYIVGLEGILTTFTDLDSGQQAVYYSIEIDAIECEASGSEDAIHEIQVSKEQLVNPFIFRIQIEKKEYIVVSLHLAEHMLRCSVYGTLLHPVNVITKGEESVC